MEMWLKTSGKQLMFPVLPSGFTIEGGSIINTATLTGSGEVSIFGGDKLRSVTIDCFFPSRMYHFIKTPQLLGPYDYVREITTWRDKGQDVRFIITDTDVNMLCYISNFEYGEQDASGDVYFSLTLLECRVPTVQKETTTNKPGNATQNKPRPDSNPPTTTTKKSHQVSKGDSLWDIAKRYYGDGSLYPKIKQANISKYPSLKNSNIIYTNMTLVIP